MDTLSRVGSWAVTNLLLGYALAFPVTSAVAFSYYVRAKVWGTVASPYGGAEAQISMAFVLVGGGVLVALAVLMNRRYRRTMRWPAFMYWLATVVLLVAPSLLFVLNESTVPQMLGKGILW